MKKTIKNIFILIVLVIIIIILNIYKSPKYIFEDIMIFSLWKNKSSKNQYEINSQKTIQIDVFTTVNKKIYKKIAPGCRGDFIIKFKRPQNSNYQINVIEKTVKPKNLIFIFENERYNTLEEMEGVINEKFIDTEKITINWEWKYHIDENHDILDTKDGEKAQRYIFEINAVVEEQERIDI